MSRQKKAKIEHQAGSATIKAGVSESEGRFQRLVESFHDIIFITDYESTMLYANPALERQTGYTLLDFQIPQENPLLHPDDARSVMNFVREFIDSEAEYSERLENRFIDKWGKVHWLSSTINKVEYNGKPALQFVTHNITERKEMEEALQQELNERAQMEDTLRQTEDRFQILAENVPGVIYLCKNDERYTMIFLNENVEALTGYAREEFLDTRISFTDLYHPDDVPAIDIEVEQALKERRQFRLTYRLKHFSGEWLWIEEIGAGIFNEQDELLFLEGFLSDITNEKAFEQALQAAAARRGRQVQISTQVAQEIAGAPDLHVLYQRVVTLVKEQFGYYYVQLLRYDTAVNAVVLIAGYGEIGEQMLAAGHQMPMGVGLIGTAAASGQSLLRADVRSDPNWRPNPLLPHTRSEIAVPIKLGSQILGVLDVQSDESISLDQEDQLMLEGLCGQIAAAIESTRLRQEMAERLDELHRLQRFFSQEGWQSFRAKSDQSAQGYLYNQSDIQPVTAALMAALQSGRIGAAEASAQSDALESITTPLAVRGAVIGTLGVHLDPNVPLTAEDEDLLESISVQVAEALESARLLEQTQRRAGELETVARVSTAASTILQVDELLQTVVDLAQKRFDLYHVSIFLLDEVEESLHLAAASGDIGRKIAAEEILIPLDEEHSLIAQAARSRKASTVNNVWLEAAYQPHPLLPNTCAEMVIPMILGDALIGVLDVQADVTNAFTTDDVRIQTTLAAQVAVSVQNANLYAEQLATAAKLRELDRLKSEFLASMSHELRTPLNSIIGFADVLLEGLDGDLTERMEEDVMLIRESGRHLRELIGDILDMSKIEAGMMELRRELVDPRQLAREAIASTSTLGQGKALEFIMDIGPDVEPISADRTRFMQVLLNLMSNAVKFTEKGSITLCMRMNNGDLITSVIDTGIGIEEEDIPAVFEQFRQVDGSHTRVVGGTGLGMPITKKLVELHGGDMGVESTPDVGSTFWFTIPKDGPVEKKPDTGPLRKPGTGPLRPYSKQIR